MIPFFFLENYKLQYFQLDFAFKSTTEVIRRLSWLLQLVFVSPESAERPRKQFNPDLGGGL